MLPEETMASLKLEAIKTTARSLIGALKNLSKSQNHKQRQAYWSNAVTHWVTLLNNQIDPKPTITYDINKAVVEFRYHLEVLHKSDIETQVVDDLQARFEVIADGLADKQNAPVEIVRGDDESAESYMERLKNSR